MSASNDTQTITLSLLEMVNFITEEIQKDLNRGRISKQHQVELSLELHASSDKLIQTITQLKTLSIKRGTH